MKNNRYKIIFSIVILIICISTYDVFAFSNINFKNITIEDGLSQATVQTIFQDSKGYVWMGTNDGLNRYNGYNMKVYKSDEGDSESIADNYILNITEDKSNNLWVSTCYGLTKINIVNGAIKNYFNGPNKGNLSDNFVNCVLVTKDNKILVGTGNGLNLYNEETDSFQRILNEDVKLTNQNIKSMTEDVHGNIWMGTKFDLNKINLNTNQIDKYYSTEEESISGNEINSLLADKSGYVWVSTSIGGLNKINVKTKEITSYKHKTEDENSLPSNTTKKMFQDKDGIVWIGTEKGLAKYTSKDEKFTTYVNKPYYSNSLSNDLVYTIMEDRSGLIWVGTYCGVSIFDPSNKIAHYKNDPLNINSLSDNVVHGIYEDKDGLLWVGTKDNGVNIIDRKNDIVNHIIEGSSDLNLSSNSVKVITGKDNIVWIGTKEGINEVNKEDMSIKKYTLNDGLTGENIKSLFLDSKGYLWIGSPDGLDILNTEDGTISSITELLLAKNITDVYIEDIYEDKDGVYWVGSFLGGGLTKIDFNNNNNNIINYKDDGYKDNSNKKGINSIRSIAEDENGNLWIGTNCGLRKFNKSKGEFTNYTTQDGLPNNTVYGVLLDDDGNPWMSTNNGISKLDVNTGEFKNLSVIDGIQGNEFNGKAYHKSISGELFFGGTNGVNSFNPNNIIQTDYSPKVVFDEFEIQGESYKDINGLKIKYGKDIIRIKYFVPNYKDNKNIQYQYKLEGFNDKWIAVSNTEVIYSNLSPGQYTFKIKVRSQNGVISEESSVKFRIEPPLWMSKCAIIIYLLAIVIIIYINKTKMSRLDNLVNKRTEQLMDEMEMNNTLLKQVIKLEKNKNNYFINLSHELRTPLNVINSVEQLITHINRNEESITAEKLNYYMDVMRKNTKRLLNLINNIIDASKFEHGSYKINLKENDIVYTVEEAALSLKDYVKAKGIELIIDTDVEEKIIMCDAYEIERCIVNLVSNAAKFTPEGGIIEVSIYDLGNQVKIVVLDSGIGIAEEYHESIFDRFNQVIDPNSEEKGGSGLGLTIIKHIIDMHIGHISVESKKNEGSKFTIILPVEAKKLISSI
ncbi:two-component regulator propeller domain-containing protein [Clostridium sp.]|uniref:ligand-binding sensor domain-containing protein n=1 Tax=Clostridium sp. TaxID=1506 RepID=UPI0032172D91